MNCGCRMSQKISRRINLRMEKKDSIRMACQTRSTISTGFIGKKSFLENAYMNILLARGGVVETGEVLRWITIDPNGGKQKSGSAKILCWVEKVYNDGDNFTGLAKVEELPVWVLL